MKEKRPGLSSSYAGKDEDSVAGLMKRLEAGQRDLQAFHTTVQRLQRLAQGLVDRGHFDHVNIQLKQVSWPQPLLLGFHRCISFSHCRVFC